MGHFDDDMMTLAFQRFSGAEGYGTGADAAWAVTLL
jgi:hypothetical protein